jgi:hypothetical protein
MKSAEVGAARLWRLKFNSYLDAPKALLKVLKHFMSTNCSLINSTSKLCRVDERVAKRTFPTLRLEPVDGLVDLLATFRACDFQRQIVEKHGLVQMINKISSVGKAQPDHRADSVLEKMIGRAIREWRDFGSLAKRIVPTSKI